MSTDRPLILGAAYHGNRMPSHAREDMRDMVKRGMDLVVHMFSHTDWDRHKEKMREIIEISKEAGLQVWVDNWGIGGPPGDKAHFLAYHPEARQVFSDGSMRPISACLNSPAYRAFSREWVDTVQYIGGETIFWDEPHLPIEDRADGPVYACACPVCRKKFEEKYGRPMPVRPDEDTRAFQLDTIADYFREVTAYSAGKGIKNAVCVMLGEKLGISLKSLGTICDIPTLDSVGSDPYWLNEPGADPYEYVYDGAKETLRVADAFGKDHNVWIQAYATPRGREEEVVAAAEAAYDAGARTIIAWGYRGSESNDYAAQNPDKAWARTCEAFRRVREMERDRQLAQYRKRLGT